MEEEKKVSDTALEIRDPTRLCLDSVHARLSPKSGVIDV